MEGLSVPQKAFTRETLPGKGWLDPVFFKLFCDTIPDPVWMKDLDGHFLYVNKAMCMKILRCRQAVTAIGKTESYFARKARRKGYRYDIDRMSLKSDHIIFSGHEAGTFYEYGFIHDKFYYFEIYKTPLVNDEGEVEGLLALAKDITAYTAAGEELEKYETQYRSIFENALEGIFQATVEGKFLSVNPAMARMFGYVTPEEMIEETGGFTGRMFVGSNRGEEFLDMLERDGMVENCQIEACRKNESRLWVTVNAWAVPGPDGSLLCYEGTIENITDRKRAEEAINNERKRFEMVFQEIPFGLVLIDSKGFFTYINDKLIDIFGYKRDDIPDGREWCRKVYPDPAYRHTVISAWKEDHLYSRANKKIARVFRCTCKDGTVKIVRFVSVRLSTKEFLLTCEDITQKRIVE